MKIYKAYKFRLYPNNNQRILLNKFLGSSRFIYNHFLHLKENKYKEGIKYNLKDMKHDLISLQAENTWLKEIDSCLLRTTLDNLDDAYTRFYNKQNSYPKYKKKTYKNSYKTTCIRSSYKNHSYANIKVDLKHKTIKLPKLEEIKIKGYRKLATFEDKKILSATISNVANKYYVSVNVEEDININEFILNKVIGIDLGVKNLVITSDGLKYKAMQNIRILEKKLKGLNRWLSRSKKGSNNRLKIINKIQRVNEKIKNKRKYYIHLITKEIVKDNDLIITENLKIKEMIENNKNLNKSLVNSSFSEIIRQLKYKSKWQNKKVIQIDTYYASSQICSCCGNKDKRLKDLSIREYRCNKCNNEIDRDINSSVNIMLEGIRKYYQ